jgi:hypothetical protein
VRLAEGLEQSVKAIVVGADQNLGDVEMEVERQSREFERAATEKAAQTNLSGGIGFIWAPVFDLTNGEKPLAGER